METFWKEDWDTARERMELWWRGAGLALCVTAPKEEPWEDIPKPERPPTEAQAWTDPVYRAREAEYTLAHTFHGGEAFPYFDTQIGPGSLATFLGSEPSFAPDTVWYEATLPNPEKSPPLCFDPQAPWFQKHLALIEEGNRIADGRFLVGMPDLIENLDTLAQLRGPQVLMEDLFERPGWVKEKVAEINQAFFESFDALFERIRDPWGGMSFSAFKIWGPGRTAKVQCDCAAMISPAMFREFAIPALTEQCRWLDYSLFHLDGTQSIRHLDALLEIEELDAIEWTPQDSIEHGGNPRWYDLYRRILDAGKSVQAVFVEPDEVVPLLDAVGPDGMFLMVFAKSETEARHLIESVEPYR